MLTEEDWDGATGTLGMNAETKGDLIEWILSFSHPVIYNTWGKRNAL